MGQYVDGGGAGDVAARVIDGGGAGDVGAYVIDGGPAGEKLIAQPPPPPMGNRGMQGDPRLIMGPNGTRLQFRGGQPLMDRGLENLVLISLFTNDGWCGNALMKSAIGSGFEAACNRPITRESINRIRMAAESALISPALGRVEVGVANPTGQQLKVSIRVNPPAGSPQEMVLLRNFGNWQYQAQDPAYLHIQ